MIKKVYTPTMKPIKIELGCEACGSRMKITDILETGALAFCRACDGVLEWREKR